MATMPTGRIGIGACGLITRNNMAWIYADSKIIATEPALVGEWIFADSRLASVEPGLLEGWIYAAAKIVAVMPSGIIVCAPGETKCVGYDLYTCSLEGRWEFTKHDATECGYVPEEKPFPWKWAGIALAALGAILLIPKKKKEKVT